MIVRPSLEALPRARRAPWGRLIALLLAGARCGGSESAPSSSGGQACEGAQPIALEALFSRHFAQAPSDGGAGCLSPGCHADGAGQLRFASAADLHAATRGVASLADPSRIYVVPGDPTRSYLLERLRGDAAGERMPSGGPFFDGDALAEVTSWICQGAPPPGEGGSGGHEGSTCLDGERACPDGACVAAGECCDDADCEAPETCSGGGVARACGCAPVGCAERGLECGELFDGCGATLDCGACQSPETCGGAGLANQCGCTPATCLDRGKNCGSLPDGCGATLECGDCDASQTCGGGGVANVCGEGPCAPTTCAALGKDCGAVSDGCGATLDCGECQLPETCGGAGVEDECGCTPTTCDEQGMNCGALDDGCGQSLDCGACQLPETCGGAGAPNQCGCTPTTCAALGATCGSADDGCGATLACGACQPGEVCSGNTCGCAASVSYAGAIQPIFDASCTQSLCHDNVGPAGALRLNTSASYGELVNGPSLCGGGKVLVKPGAVAQSYLMNKLTGLGMCSGAKMPKGLAALPQAQMAAIGAWICNGAPNN